MQRDSAICSTRATLTEDRRRDNVTACWHCQDSCGARTTAYNVEPLCCIVGDLELCTDFLHYFSTSLRRTLMTFGMIMVRSARLLFSGTNYRIVSLGAILLFQTVCISSPAVGRYTGRVLHSLSPNVGVWLRHRAFLVDNLRHSGHTVSTST